MVFYVLNSFSIWLVSVIAVRWSYDYERESFGRLLLKVLLSPPVIGVSIGLVLVLLDVHLPSFASSFIRRSWPSSRIRVLEPTPRLRMAISRRARSRQPLISFGLPAAT